MTVAATGSVASCFLPALLVMLSLLRHLLMLAQLTSLRSHLPLPKVTRLMFSEARIESPFGAVSLVYSNSDGKWVIY